MTKQEYKEYLQTPYWNYLKKRYTTNKKMFKVWVCWICRKHKSFYHLHHKSYDNLFKERWGKDIIRVCSKCHKLLHFDELGNKLNMSVALQNNRAKQLRKIFLSKN
jgi:hypothetical protein